MGLGQVNQASVVEEHHPNRAPSKKLLVYYDGMARVIAAISPGSVSFHMAPPSPT